MVIEQGWEESLVRESGDGLVAQGKGDVGAGRDLQGSPSPDEEPPALRPEGSSSGTLGRVIAQRHPEKV